MDTYVAILLWVIPGFLMLVLIEILYGHYKKKQTYTLMDTISSLSSGITNILKDSMGIIFIIISYSFLEKKIAIFQLESSLTLYVLAFICIDFASYWSHRLNHKINIFWNQHIIHHSSEEFNISTAMRQASTGFYFKWVFYIPLAILGIPLQIFIIIGLIDLLYQVWVHTQLVGRLGWLELFLVTPSNHRVHHGQNDYCIDRNYGGIFSIWDRFFGTYADERKEEPIVFGIRKPLGSWNPVWGNLHYYFTILTKVKSTPHWNEKLMAVFGDPAWVPSGKEAEQIPSPILETYEKLSLNSPCKIKFLGIFTTFSFALFLLFYLGTRNQMSFFLQVTWVAMAVLILGGIGSIWGSARYNRSKR